MASTLFLSIIFVPVLSFYGVFFVFLCKDCLHVSHHHFFVVKRWARQHTAHRSPKYFSDDDDLSRAA